MLKKIGFIFSIVVFCTAFGIPEKVEKKANKVMAKYYDKDDLSKETIMVSEEAMSKVPSQFKEGNLFKISSGETFLGYGYIGNAPSKTATFDYLVLFDSDFIITKSKVLIYREEYGGEIGSKRWLKQFVGKTLGSSLSYNKEIIPISGATISVKSMTLAVNQLLQSIKELRALNEI